MSKKNQKNHKEEQQVDNQELHNEKLDNQTENQETAEDTTEFDKDQEIKVLQDKCADLTDKNIRMMAEFDNFRRRTNKEKLDLLNTAGERIFVDMLPLIDDFERALNAMQQSDDIEALREGINLIYSKFTSFLDKNQVKPITTDNADFNTEFHEAITTFPAPTPEQKGKVIDCTQKGYTLGDKVIRFAKVVVGE